MATRRARSGPGFQKFAYIPERRSTSSPRPSASVMTGDNASRQTAATGPSPGREASPERRYAGMRSPNRTIPNRLDATATREVARRLAAAERLATSSAS